MARGRVSAGAKDRQNQRAVTFTTLRLREAIKPAAAWKLLATLRSAAFAIAPTAFRTAAELPPRRLGRRAEAMVVERLSTGAYVELLRRTGQPPRILLRSGASGGAYLLILYSPPLAVAEEVMTFVEFIKQLYDVLHPLIGRADVVSGLEAESVIGGSGSIATMPAILGQENQTVTGWLSVLSPEKVEELGAARLLMAPVFLIEMLSDGGLLVVETPMPLAGGRGAGGRSPAILDHLLGEGVASTGAPVWLERVGRSRETIRVVDGPAGVRES